MKELSERQTKLVALMQEAWDAAMREVPADRIRIFGGPPHLMPEQWADGAPPSIDTAANKWWRNGAGND